MAMKRLWRRVGVHAELEGLKKYLDMLDSYLEGAKKELENQPLLGFFLDEKW